MSTAKREVLKKLGFSDFEIAIYMLLLTGELNGNQLAEELNTDRTGVYRTLKGMEQKGYIASTNQKYNRSYYVEDVMKLLQTAEENVDDAQKTYKDAKEFLDSIPFVSSEQVLKSKVKVYRGDDSIIKVYQEKNRSRDPLLREISNSLVFPNIKEGFWDKEIAIRIANKSFLHQLVDRSDDSTKYHRTNKSQFKEVRVIPSDFVMSAGINIYMNKIAFHNNSVANPLALIVEDKAMAALMKNFFDFVWNRSQLI